MMNQSPKGIMRSAVPLPYFFDVSKSQEGPSIYPLGIEGPKGLSEGSESLLEGCEGLPEGSEGLPEGFEGLPEGP